MFKTRSIILKSIRDIVDINNASAKSIAEAAKPCVWFKTCEADDSEIPIGKTKLGGCPDLPSDIRWPTRPSYANPDEFIDGTRELLEAVAAGQIAMSAEQVASTKSNMEAQHRYASNSAYLHFIGQFNFAECLGPKMSESALPVSGLLSIFYDAILQPWGYRPEHAIACRVIYTPADTMLERKERPDVFASYPEAGIPPAAILKPHLFMAPIPPDAAAFDALGLNEDVQESYREWSEEDDRLFASSDGRDPNCHRLGGWPTPMQNDMQFECAAATSTEALDWIFICQIGSDDAAGLMWGDGGQIYLWIHRDDLAKNRFERARLILQCG